MSNKNRWKGSGKE